MNDWFAEALALLFFASFLCAMISHSIERKLAKEHRALIDRLLLASIRDIEIKTTGRLYDARNEAATHTSIAGDTDPQAQSQAR